MDINSLFGEEFINFVESEKAKNKSLDQIASEHNKTKEAIRSKLKREKKKIGYTPESTPIKNNKNINKISNKKQIKRNNIDMLDLDKKLDFIINLLENNNEKKKTVQNIPQEVQIDVQEKEIYFKTSIRIKKDVWEKFKNFCAANNKYKQQDLVSLAFKEFLEKYGR